MQWFESWFDSPYYHILYKDRDFEEAKRFIDKLLNEIKLPQNSLIVDLACGRGRHSVYLNHKKYRVLGLDLSKESIRFNKQFENETLSFRVHDMKDPIVGENADAIMNLFTSFGYFDRDNDDEKVFESVSNSLKNNGLLMYASYDVYLIICSTEKKFSIIIEDSRKQIPKRDAYNAIVTRITRKFVLNTNVFPLDNRCFNELEIGTETPHRVQLITAICRQYLTMRMFSHSNKLSKEITPISQRHRLTKLILFKNT